MSDGVLVLLPTITAARLPDGRISLTKKFTEGVSEYLEFWKGPVRVLLEPAERASGNLDNVGVRPEDLPFEVRVVDYLAGDLAAHLREAEVVHGAASHRQNHVADLARRLGVACVYGTEYSLKTRCQIVNAETANPLKRARRWAWAAQQELAQRSAIAECPGVQCNGTPTYDAYQSLTKLPLLYFDTRTRSADVIEEAALERRIARLLEGKPLRLAFTGRLDPMKGAGALPGVARTLRDLGVPFTLDVCGDGSLAGELRGEIARSGLSDVVRMRGVLDFRTELVPFVRSEVDLFVCPHVQGDPSCTYLETFACGVPIVGFDNEAFTGLLHHVDAGWITPLGDERALATRIAALGRRRAELAEASRRARRFALDHTFEREFERRVEHFRTCAGM